MNEYTIDLESFTLEAENEEEALEEALLMLREGWAEIDQIWDEGEIDE